MNSAQHLAADPAVSAFVRANAGSGKTKTLIDRTARLLLTGAEPNTILCVTYTKAAAAEMQRRLFRQLGQWAVKADEPLRQELADLTGQAPTSFEDRDLREARKLFARALETPGGLRIQTIHAFCERLLRRFPLEAGIAPTFEVADDAAAAILARTARNAVAESARSGDIPALSDAYARFAVALDPFAFEEMFAVFETERSAVAKWRESLGGLPPTAAIARLCGLVMIEDAGDVETRALLPPELDPADYRAAAKALSRGAAKTDETNAVTFDSIAAAAERGEAMVDAARGIFFTGKGEPRARLGPKDAHPRILHWLTFEQERLKAAFQQARACRVAEDTVWARSLASAYGAAYEKAKAARGVLDFADLVEKTCHLLRDAPAAAWVLYKLDGGIDHILLDEAQDTAPDQWKIIDGLAGEFFSGAGRPRDTPIRRSLFVVGDRKQSIYSFQGAAPEQLETQTQVHLARIAEAGGKVRDVALIESWRSTGEVLTFVDRVFEPADLLSAIEGSANVALAHQPMRADGPGCVDLWEPEQEIPEDERIAWDAPLDVEGAASANRRLARKIASEIKALVARGDAVFDKDLRRRRTAAWGDVLILVRRRGVLFEDILRELKHLDVPVAGADRLALSAHIAFDDLLALARFSLFPRDDLTLAALLKSPFCDLADDDLFGLAFGRGKEALWDVIIRRAVERPQWTRALAFLQAVRAEASTCRPFDFYSRVLARLDGQGRSGRRLMFERLGAEASDAIDEFLAQVLAAEQRGVRDLESLADALASLDITVKREMDEARSEVRVMTAHGAKGLEAPIVFLPEMTLTQSARGGAWLKAANGGFLWCSSGEDDCDASALARAERKRRDEEERQRLFYVALTRARDRLVLCGRINAKAKREKVGGWYAAAEAALAHAEIAGGVRALSENGQDFRRYGPDPERLPAEQPAPSLLGGTPRWLSAPPPVEPSQAGPRAPSAGVVKDSALSPLTRAGGLGRFRRGNLIHRLLQLLPDVPAEGRAAAAVRLLAREPDLSEGQRAEMATAALGVLNDARFAAVFGPGSRAEVAIAGPAINGQIDRLVVGDDRILVVDFKTNRPAPGRIEDADPAYIRQMAVYSAALAEAFPGRTVEAALVWTDGPKLMAVSENLLAGALAEPARPT